MKNILVVLGTRPEVIKLAPIILELRKQPDIYNVIVCNTEQQKELSNQTLNYFGLKADINLDCMRHNQTLAEVQIRILDGLNKVFQENKIDATFVQGDTMTVLCGSLISFYNKVPLYHVEAGLRSYNLFEPFPEEAVRQMSGRIADIHFAPTETNKEALLKENIDSKKIHVVGNTVIDALHCLSVETMQNAKQFFIDKNIIVDDKIVLVTVHRRENHGERLNKIIQAIYDLAIKYNNHLFVIPVHPNPNVKEKIYDTLSSLSNVKLLDPLDYPNLVYLMKNAKLILTDSGGIQEEAPTFGCPTLVMRYETERKEGVEAGVSVLVGADEDKIINYTSKILDNDFASTRLKVQNPYGDGKSAQRIIKTITERIIYNYE